MARRRRKQAPLNAKLVVGLMVLAVLWAVILAAVHDWPVTVVVLAIVGGVYYWRHQRRRAAIERAEREAAETWEANRAAWRELSFDEGTYSVVVSKFVEYGAEESVAELLSDIPGLRDAPPDQVEALVERVVHVGPQAVAEGISQRSAIHLKEALELRGAKVRIKERASRSANGSGRREAIPQRVREEVWRRDEGRCVDCGSRERLEYDHIIAVANGGSNTARNIELRCEKCNRSKGASI